MSAKKLLFTFTLMLTLFVLPAAAPLAHAAPSGAPDAPGRRTFLPLVSGPQTPQVGIAVGASPLEVAPGNIVTLASGLTNQGASDLDVDVTVTVTDANGVERFRHTWSRQHIDPGQVGQLSGHYELASTACAGQYTAGVVLQASQTGAVIYSNPAIATFRVVPLQPQPATPTPPTPTPPPPPTANAIYWGVNMEGVPWDMNRLAAWERDVTGKPVSIVHWGHFWNNNGGYRNWSNSAVNNARNHGSIPMISWTPEGGDNSRWQLSKIINGAHDAYIRQFAMDAKNWGHPFFLRIMHEMNGSWGYPWQETQNGNKRGEFVQAWRRIVDIFRQVGVTNASYVWCPNIDYPNSPNPSFQSLYPGDGYVDWTCLDGYNWGSNRSSGWESFDKVYNYSYNEILKFAPSKPMMIGEFGSVEQGGSKADWFADALTGQIPGKYKQIRAALYFDWAFDGVDWRITTSNAARDAFRRGIGSSHYAPNQYGSISGKVAVP
jgi:hypothetical protein